MRTEREHTCSLRRTNFKSNHQFENSKRTMIASDQTNIVRKNIYVYIYFLFKIDFIYAITIITYFYILIVLFINYYCSSLGIWVSCTTPGQHLDFSVRQTITPGLFTPVNYSTKAFFFSMMLGIVYYSGVNTWTFQ